MRDETELATTTPENHLRGDVLVIRDLEMLKLISDPLRLRLLEITPGWLRCGIRRAQRRYGRYRSMFMLDLFKQIEQIGDKACRMIEGASELHIKANFSRCLADHKIIYEDDERWN